MKPTTPQEFANCYGTFFADIVIIGKTYQVLNWVKSNIADAYSVYQLNTALFSAYPASITSFPKIVTIVPKEKEARQEYSKDLKSNQQLINIVWTSATMDLKAALTCAEVDPSKIVSILASFAKLKPSLPSIK